MRTVFLLFVSLIFAHLAHGQAANSETAVVSFRPAPLFFKRRDLTDAQIALIQEELEINNLNVMLRRPVNDETIVLGTLEKIECTGGQIYFRVSLDGKTLDLTAERFGDIKFGVLTPGTRAFTFKCDGGFPDEKVAVIYRPAAGSDEEGVLTSLTFVPKIFRLKSLDAIAREPTIVIEGLEPTNVEANIREAETERVEMERVTREARELELQNIKQAEPPPSHDAGGEGGLLSFRRVTDLVGTGLRPDRDVDADGISLKIRRDRNVKPK